MNWPRARRSGFANPGCQPSSGRSRSSTRHVVLVAKLESRITTLGPTAGNRTAPVTLGIHQSGPLAPIVALLAGGRTKRYVQMEADGLKTRCEAAQPV